MKFGYYADNELPYAHNPEYKVNSHGYRCPEFSSLSDGRKNVVVLGCSHTFGEGLNDNETWVSLLENLLSQKRLRFWNLGQPGSSPDKCVRILYGSEKVLFPKIIIVCWPATSRRERLDDIPKNLTSDDEFLKFENEHTDRNNFLKCVFQIEKFGEQNNATVFHCFAHEVDEIPGARFVLNSTTLRTCWPEWSNTISERDKRVFISTPSVARDGKHFGVEHHRTFAKKFYSKFGSKLK